MELRDQLQETLGGAYTLERELSGGGMSRVFVANETALGRSVVIKVLAAELTGGVNIDRFRREILLAAKLQMSDSALVMFEAYLNRLDAQRLEPDGDPALLAGTYKRLGELCEGTGDRAKAAANYRRFVELWKDADPDLQPKVVEVRRRLARLGGIEGR